MTYELVTTSEALDTWCKRIIEAGVVAIDTETTSVNASRAKLVGVSLCVENGSACYIPVGHVTVGRQLPLRYVVMKLRPILHDKAILKIGQNVKYDWHVLSHYGIFVEPFEDTMVMSYVLDGGLHGHGMDELAALHLGHQTIPYEAVTGVGKKQISFADVPLRTACEYAAEDADITLRLYHVLKQHMLRDKKVLEFYNEVEHHLPVVVARMEMYGAKVSVDVLKDMTKEFDNDLIGIEKAIYELAGKEFNIGSTQQLSTVLFDDLGIKPIGRKGKNGAYSTDEKAMSKLAEKGVELCIQVLKWRKIKKMRSTYTTALVEDINPRTGRIHTSYGLAHTNTGRFSSSSPNLQNIPIRTEIGKRIRKAFVAEPGHKIISADYSQIELRLVAHIAGLKVLQDAFVNGDDVHRMTAAQVFGLKMEDVDDDTRRRAKTINFGIIYGISEYGLGAQLGIDPEEAKEFIDRYLGRFPELKNWMDDTKDFCREHGYVTTAFGRRCYIPGIEDPNYAKGMGAERQAINAPIQGTAADIIKRAMVQVSRALEEAGYKTRMLLQVHDELIFEAPIDEAEGAAKLISEVMEKAALPQLTLPLIAEANIGDSWGEAH